MRAVVVQQLQSLEYAVSQAASGDAGLACFETAAYPFDLLVTDVMMPGSLNGKGLADEVGHRWPKTKIVFMSGFAENIIARRTMPPMRAPNVNPAALPDSPGSGFLPFGT